MQLHRDPGTKNVISNPGGSLLLGGEKRPRIQNIQQDPLNIHSDG